MISSSYFRKSKICFTCDLPATIICKCQDNPTYICDEHAFEHLDKEGSHPVELLHSYLSLCSDSLEDERNLEQDGYRIRGHTRPITSISVLNDCLVTGEGDGLYRWSLQDKLLMNRFETQCQVWAVSVNHMKNIVAAGLDDHKIILIDSLLENVLFRITEHQGAVFCLRFTNNGNYLVSGCGSGFALISNIHCIIKKKNDALYRLNWPNVDLFDTKQYRLKKSPQQKSIIAIAASCNSEYIITASMDKKIKIYSFELFQLLITLYSSNPILAIEITKNNLLVYGGIELLKVYDLNDMKKIHKFKVKNQIIYSILIPQNSEYIYITNSKNEIKKIYIDNYKKTTLIRKKNEYYLNSLVFNYNEDKIFAVLGGWTVGIFSNKLKFEGLIGNNRFLCAKLSNNFRHIFAFYVNGGIQAHNIETKLLEKSYSSAHEIDKFWESYNKRGYFQCE